MAATTVSRVRAAALRKRCLSLAKTCSIGFRSGEYLGRKNSFAPAERMAWRTASPLWLPRLSMITRSPGLSVGASAFATKVMVCQWPWGTFATKRLPFGAQPRSGSMLVFVPVSSMNTRRLGSIRLWRFVHWARRRATSGRSRSLATTVFFEAELLGVNKIPHRPIIDLKPALSQFGHQPAQGEGPVPDAPRQKSRVLAGDRLGLMPAHLARRDAPRLPKPPHPINHRARRDPEARRRLMPRQPFLQNRSHRALAKIHRIRLAH